MASGMHQVDNIAPFYDFSQNFVDVCNKTVRFQGYDSYYTQSHVISLGSISVSARVVTK